jgi:hypothetical protein
MLARNQCDVLTIDLQQNFKESQRILNGKKPNSSNELGQTNEHKTNNVFVTFSQTGTDASKQQPSQCKVSAHIAQKSWRIRRKDHDASRN